MLCGDISLPSSLLLWQYQGQSGGSEGFAQIDLWAVLTFVHVCWCACAVSSTQIGVLVMPFNAVRHPGLVLCRAPQCITPEQR
jgi:hypothetical protein